MKFKSSRNYIVYDKGNEAVRFAMNSEMEPLQVEDDPCRHSDAPSCQFNSYCMNVNSKATCVCEEGYENDPIDNNRCVDEDECKAISVHQCDRKMANSECINTIGSYQCSCKRNYIQRDNECIMVSSLHI